MDRGRSETSQERNPARVGQSGPGRMRCPGPCERPAGKGPSGYLSEAAREGGIPQLGDSHRAEGVSWPSPIPAWPETEAQAAQRGSRKAKRSSPSSRASASGDRAGASLWATTDLTCLILRRSRLRDPQAGSSQGQRPLRPRGLGAAYPEGRGLDGRQGFLPHGGSQGGT
jgi:hypothetical protein